MIGRALLVSGFAILYGVALWVGKRVSDHG